MRYFCASLALCAVFLSILFVPAASAQKRIKAPGPKAQVSSSSISEDKPEGTTDSLVPSSSQTEIVGPAGSGLFGQQVTVLPNGNIVVTDPGYDITTPSLIQDVGAVYLYNGETLEMISQLTGSTATDAVGTTGVTVLSNGNYVVRSHLWNNGTALDAGAVTWGSRTTGVSGVVSASNSLVGSNATDTVGNGGVTTLSNGNYVVRSSAWDNGAARDAGSVTWGNGTTGTSGIVSAANSLVGSLMDDRVGFYGVTALGNGNYVVVSRDWNNGTATGAGAVTWGDGMTGISGVVSASNSLVGSTAGDVVGLGGIIELSNGNYVVRSQSWDSGTTMNAGAVTWGSGTVGVSGVVSATNSLVGSTTNDEVGNGGVIPLSNGNYVAGSYYWDNGGVTDAGAVTWGDGTTGISGAVSATNSLVGSVADDQVGGGLITALSNGNYVVRSSSWDNAAVMDAGAVTWGNGTTGISGVVSSANSLVGSTASDNVGNSGIFALSNGNYVVRSFLWDNGTATNAGAATWGSGMSGISGVVSASNSLIGSTANDNVGSSGITELSNGNYVLRSSSWDNGTTLNVGAVTWGSGTTGISGVLSTANSLVGSSANDNVGISPVTALSNGNYVVRSSSWDNGSTLNVGAVTWGNGMTGISGVVSSGNSMIGSTANDNVGSGGVTALSNGNYVVATSAWDNGAAADAGAVSWRNGTAGTSGVVSEANSIVGSTTSDGVGTLTIIALSNGNFVVRVPTWDNGAAMDAGAVTWGNGITGISGVVSADNSLVGSTLNDQIGNTAVTALINGNYVVSSTLWDNGAIVNARGITYGAGNGGTVGEIDSSNSVLGTVASGTVSPAGPANAPISNERLVVGRPSSNVVSIFNPTYRAITDGNWSSAATWNYGAFSKPHDVVMPEFMEVELDTDIPGPGGSLTIEPTAELIVNADRTSGSPIRNEGILSMYSGKLNMGANVFTSACSTNEFVNSPSSYFIGAVRKEICVLTSYVLPVGTADGYTPVSVNVTALGASPSSLTVSSTANVHPTLYGPNSLKRFWSITESGDLTADLTFNYLDGDVVGNESGYKLYRIEGAGLPESMSAAVLNAGSNSMSIAGVSQFSDWAIGSLAPSSAGVSVSGRVMANGRPVSRASVVFYGADGSVRLAVTNTFGYYRIDGLMSGSTYTASVNSRRYTFDARLVNLGDDLAGLDFQGR